METKEKKENKMGTLMIQLEELQAVLDLISKELEETVGRINMPQEDDQVINTPCAIDLIFGKVNRLLRSAGRIYSMAQSLCDQIGHE